MKLTRPPWPAECRPRRCGQASRELVGTAGARASAELAAHGGGQHGPIVSAHRHRGVIKLGRRG
jgi:hypothetical protein